MNLQLSWKNIKHPINTFLSWITFSAAVSLDFIEWGFRCTHCNSQILHEIPEILPCKIFLNISNLLIEKLMNFSSHRNWSMYFTQLFLFCSYQTVLFMKILVEMDGRGGGRAWRILGHTEKTSFVIVFLYSLLRTKFSKNLIILIYLCVYFNIRINEITCILFHCPYIQNLNINMSNG